MSGKTVFVVGAGASSEVGLPLGFDLKTLITHKLKLDRDGNAQGTTDENLRAIFNRIANKTNDKNHIFGEFQKKANQMARGLPLARSIDNYLHDHSSDPQIVQIGKLAIVSSILEAERKSDLWIDPDRRPADSTQWIGRKRYENSWYPALFQLMTDKCKASDLKERFKKYSFIIFNYDRCIEHFLERALKVYYPVLDDDDIFEIMSNLNLEHPYGRLGTLGWQVKGKGGPDVEFGGQPGSEDKYIELSENILTFTEAEKLVEGTVNSIQSQVQQCERLVFLGFGFIPLNLDLIAPFNQQYTRRGSFKCIATVKGISEPNRDQYVKVLANRLNTVEGNILTESCSCAELISGYSSYLEDVN
ncbi:hypothetical protein [Arenicella xantha]|uniref:SIR2-like protein n=1 Tax=Arenicella xantha TaxID=644221 RepID=A0A395JQH0_9GAMM|nr:hypothetical protein [Arenicella xantha]RBP51724.1 hypothetical protein DFR28_1021157 [Arenicella xantha]